ncbi:MAG: NUDIX domain-containing protein [Lachnospiraceae bacterium]|nr:NUDIX domain-containing protein [Lachnospiraceae bacterium]
MMTETERLLLREYTLDDPDALYEIMSDTETMLKTVEILGANRFDNYTKTRDGSRAVIVQDGKILLTHELKSGWWLLPGGGMEEGETPEDCVIREVLEETGLIVRPTKHFLTLHEYYEEYRYTGYFFVCEVMKKGQMNLTDEEKQRGVQPEWIPLQDAIELFSKHELYADISEEKRGAYQREYIALKEYMNLNSGSCLYRMEKKATLQ